MWSDEIECDDRWSSRDLQHFQAPVHTPLYHSPIPPDERTNAHYPTQIATHTQPYAMAWKADPGDNHVQYKMYSVDRRAPSTRDNRRQKSRGQAVQRSDDALNASSDTEALYQQRYFNPHYSSRRKPAKRYEPRFEPPKVYAKPEHHMHRHSMASRAASPGSLMSNAAVDGCGGHCTACQNFCYYFLQVIFVIIILTGVAFCIAGSVLRRNKTHDLSVLVYIGCLISLVASFLLAIQYCVRRNVKRRKIQLRAGLNVVQMTDLTHNVYQMDPIVAGTGTGTLNRADRGYSSVQQDEDGIPWWRREPYADR